MSLEVYSDYFTTRITLFCYITMGHTNYCRVVGSILRLLHNRYHTILLRNDGTYEELPCRSKYTPTTSQLQSHYFVKDIHILVVCIKYIVLDMLVILYQYIIRVLCCVKNTYICTYHIFTVVCLYSIILL